MSWPTAPAATWAASVATWPGPSTQAVADGVDVINYSIGSDTPGLIGPDDMAFLFAADAGVFVCDLCRERRPGRWDGRKPGVGSLGDHRRGQPAEEDLHRRGEDRGVTEPWSDGKGPGIRVPRSHPEPTDSSPSSTQPTMATSCAIRRSGFHGGLTGKVVLCLRGGPAQRREEPCRIGGRWVRHGSLQRRRRPRPPHRQPLGPLCQYQLHRRHRPQAVHRRRRCCRYRGNSRRTTKSERAGTRWPLSLLGGRWAPVPPTT